MRFTFLGTSGAWPTPRVGCACPQCAEARVLPALRRTRSSLRMDLEDEIVLVDPGPDVWHQFEREGFPPRVDRVLVTHTHADHCLGLDDLCYMQEDRLKRRIPVHAAPYHQERLRGIFPHLLEGDRARIELLGWEPGDEMTLGGVEIRGFETGHRERFPTTAPLLTIPRDGESARIAYATDMGSMPQTSKDLLFGIDLFVGDGSFLGEAGHGHPGTDEVIALGAELGIGRTAFTHVGHWKLEDADARARLGEDVGLAYDGGDLLSLLGT